MKEISIYIHIPFCIRKCNYCTFNSYKINGFDNYFIKKYFQALMEEIDNKQDIFSNRKIKSIYFGGGTPSIINPNFYQNIIDKFNWSEDTEITFEANPGTFDSEQLTELKTMGINRLSLGVQTFDNVLLKILGRIYNLNQLLKSLEIVKNIFDNFSMDMIFGIPGQNIETLEKDLNFISNFTPKHISYYMLTIEQGSNFQKSNIKEISDNLFEKFYNLIVSKFENNNYLQYEISNFSKKGFESRHNLTYWNYEEYLGFGAGACSFIGNIRYQNEHLPEKYINNSFLKEKEYLDDKTMINEYIFLNLRKREGIDFEKFNEKFSQNFLEMFRDKIEKLIEENLVQFSDKNIFLTQKGITVSNSVFVEFMN